MPKYRMTEAIEFVDPKLDVSLTAPFEPSVLCMIIWEQTNIKPVMKINDLRCGSYLEVYQRLRCASERLKTIPAKAQVYKEYVDRITQAGDLEEFIMEHAIAAGFNPEWLEKVKKRKNDDKLIQQKLHKMFASKVGGSGNNAQ